MMSANLPAAPDKNVDQCHFSSVSRFLYWVDSKYRKFDWWWNRTTGGLLSRCTWVPEHFKNQAPINLVVFLLLLIVLTLGPSLRVHFSIAVTASLLTLIGFLVFTYLASHFRRTLFLAQYVTVGILAIVLYFILPPQTEATRQLYAHWFLPFALIVFTTSAFARLGARWLLRKLFRQFPVGDRPHELLTETELFVVPDKHPTVKTGSFVLAFMTVPLRYPIELFFPAALFIDVFGFESIVHWISVAVLLIIVASVLALGDIYQRLGMIRDALRRSLLYGGLWVTSLAVIGFAIAWLTEFGYVRTVMESDRFVVLQYLGAFYLLFWVHEYWVNRAISEELLCYLDSNPLSVRGQASVFYPYTPTVPLQGPNVPKVAPHGRCVQIQGASRFVVVGHGVANSSGGFVGEVWQTYERSALFEKLADCVQNPERAKFISGLMAELRRRLRAYFTILNFVILVVVGGSLCFIEQRPRTAVASVRKGPDEELLDPLQLVFKAKEPENQTAEADGSHPKRPRVILLAASGGGTRAALYTASLLHGLAKAKAIDDVSIVSGVSGGGVALAYFAVHREELRDPDSMAWTRFHEAMASPFIEDVLRGAAEARIAEGTPLGALLAESLATQFWNAKIPAADRTLGRATGQTGLILNSTLCGQFPPDFGSLKTATDKYRFFADYASGQGAGGRVAFSNLACRDALLKSERHPTLGHLPYVVIDDPTINLATVAALNANFPPVFPNAAVDISDDPYGTLQRCWVTDGGAEENRGLISLLLVLRQAIVGKSKAPKSLLPEITVVVAEASAGSLAYKHDRGIGAASGASGALALALAQELLADVQRLYRLVPDQGPEGSRPAIQLHFLPMPSVLRVGGLGTHWMLPTSVRLSKTGLAGEKSEPKVQLTQKEIREVIQELHQLDGPPKQGSPAVRTVRKWIDDDPLVKHPAAWKDLCKQLEWD